MVNGGWNFAGDPAVVGGSVTLIEGSTFCLSDQRGDIAPDSTHGLFYDDTRILSTWQLLVDDHPIDPLSVAAADPYAATFLGRARPREGRVDPTLIVERRRYVGAGMREDLSLRNFGSEPAGVIVTVRVDADLADLFEVKEGRVGARERSVDVADDTVAIRMSGSDRDAGVCIHGTYAVAAPNQLSYRLVVPAKGTWQVSFQVLPVVGGVQGTARYPLGRPVDQTAPARRMRSWRDDSPQVHTSWDEMARAIERSTEDLGALRVADPDRPGDGVVAAGAPWFMTLFGRDSLLTSLMMPMLDHAMGLDTARTLARYQGTSNDPLSEEQPGRILHEIRFGTDAALALGGSNVYYGTVDATPLFVMLLAELRRWGVGGEELAPLMDAADAALTWIDEYGDRDGDGFVEYLRASDLGLANQAWKDSFDGITYADGRIAEPPLAVAEVQAYVYGARMARAYLARDAGDTALAAYWCDRAAQLKRAYNDRFWLPQRQCYALALDADKRPVDAVASNMGHGLWTGIVDGDKAAAVARYLVSPEMFSGWGVRTLATSMAAYNPVSYHNGSVWPHDNAIVAAGLMRYGFVAEAQQVASAVVATAAVFGARLPELFCGFDRDEHPVPVAYPTSCSPQAWAAGAVVQILRTLLRLEPSVPEGTIWIAPALPDVAGQRLTVEGIPLAGRRVTIEVIDGELTVHGLPGWLRVVREAAPFPP